MKSKSNPTAPPRTRAYRHPSAEALMRPEVGTQARFRKQKPPAKYRYDDSLDPEPFQQEIRILYDRAAESEQKSRDLLDKAKTRVEQLIEEAARR